MRSPKKHSYGFSLVELMVGMVIALASSVIIFQIFATTERQKRTVTGTADAQINGGVALDMLIREISQAGYGLYSMGFKDCNPGTTYSYFDDGGSGGSTNPTLIPLTIQDGGSGPDAITLSVSSDPSADDQFGRFELRDTMPQPSSELDVSSTYGCAVGSLMMMVQPCTLGATPAGTCTLMQVTHVQDSALKIQHNPGGTPSYNPSASYQNANNWPAFQVSGTCKAYGVCMPRPPTSANTTFDVDTANRALRVNGTTLTTNIMDLQAQYGIDSDLDPDNTTLVWTAPSAVTPSTMTKDQLRQIKAVRIAIIARNGEYEKPAAGSTTCDTTAAGDISAIQWEGTTTAIFSTSNWPAEWQCYRYKVFQAVVPLRNVIWSDY